MKRKYIDLIPHSNKLDEDLSYMHSKKINGIISKDFESKNKNYDIRMDNL